MYPSHVAVTKPRLYISSEGTRGDPITQNTNVLVKKLHERAGSNASGRSRRSEVLFTPRKSGHVLMERRDHTDACITNRQRNCSKPSGCTCEDEKSWRGIVSGPSGMYGVYPALHANGAGLGESLACQGLDAEVCSSAPHSLTRTPAYLTGNQYASLLGRPVKRDSRHGIQGIEACGG